MVRKVCTAGVFGPFSFMILEHQGSVVSSIRDEHKQIVTRHANLDFATQWTERKIRDLIGRQYETD